MIAREHGFQSWPKFAKHIAELTHDPAVIWKLAERAVITGDVASLQSLLREHEQLFREGTAPEYGPGGLRPDYSGGDAAAVLLREHQFEAWPQFENYLADRARGTALAAKFEAAADAIVSGDAATLERLLGNPWSIVNGYLANGRFWAAEFLAERGARLDLEGAAGVGRLDLVKNLFNADGCFKPNATGAQMKDGFTWACEFGRSAVVEFLLERGIDVSARFRHHGQTGLHWAAGGAHVETVKVLLARKAPVDIKDETWAVADE